MYMRGRVSGWRARWQTQASNLLFLSTNQPTHCRPTVSTKLHFHRPLLFPRTTSLCAFSLVHCLAPMTRPLQGHVCFLEGGGSWAASLWNVEVCVWRPNGDHLSEAGHCSVKASVFTVRKSWCSSHARSWTIRVRHFSRNPADSRTNITTA